MKSRIFLLGGVIAPLIYALAVILGGVLRPGYNHISQAVSELIEVGAPNKAILNPLFILYNLLTAAFGLGLFYFVRSKSQPSGGLNSGSIAALVLVAEAVFGFVTVFFPQDVPGTPFTATGTTHIVLAGLSSLTSMAAILLLALWLRGIPGMQGYRIYSWISLAIVFLTGGTAAFMTAKGIPINGLMERITIGGFLQWMLVMAIKLFQMG